MRRQSSIKISVDLLHASVIPYRWGMQIIQYSYTGRHLLLLSSQQGVAAVCSKTN